MTTHSEKPNKAATIRNYMAENPKAKPREIAKALGCNIAYVYLIRKQNKAKKPTAGQVVLRREMSNEDARIELLKMENAELRKKIDGLHTVINYLENRLHGSSI